MKKLFCLLALAIFNFGYSLQADKTTPLLETPGNPNQLAVTRQEEKHWLSGLRYVAYNEWHPDGSVVQGYRSFGGVYASSVRKKRVDGQWYNLGNVTYDDEDTFTRLQKAHGQPELDAEDKWAQPWYDGCCCFLLCFGNKK